MTSVSFRMPEDRSVLTKSEDAEQFAVGGQGTVRILCQDLLGQQFAELYAFLIEGVDVPREALEHDFVLEVRQDRAQALRCDLVAYDNGRRPAAREVLVGVLIVFAAGTP